VPAASVVKIVVSEWAAMRSHPRVDHVGRPHSALLEVGRWFREVGSAGDLIGALPADAIEAVDADLVCSVEPD
jgi:hypothetical protein